MVAGYDENPVGGSEALERCDGFDELLLEGDVRQVARHGNRVGVALADIGEQRAQHLGPVRLAAHALPRLPAPEALRRQIRSRGSEQRSRVPVGDMSQREHDGRDSDPSRAAIAAAHALRGDSQSGASGLGAPRLTQ